LRHGCDLKMQHDLKAFAAQVARLGLSETGHAIALLWYLEETGAATETTAARLATLMHELSLRGRINVSRLARQLAANRDVIKGKSPGTFKLRLASKPRLAERYAKLAAIRAPQ
jgi:predicted deacetylase